MGLVSVDSQIVAAAVMQAGGSGRNGEMVWRERFVKLQVKLLRTQAWPDNFPLYGCIGV
jgi:hypothetical protein